MAIADYFSGDRWQSDRQLVAWPKQSDLAAWCGMSRRGVQDSLDLLAKRGHLVDPAKRGRGLSNEYVAVFANAQHGCASIDVESAQHNCALNTGENAQHGCASMAGDGAPTASEPNDAQESSDDAQVFGVNATPGGGGTKGTRNQPGIQTGIPLKNENPESHNPFRDKSFRDKRRNWLIRSFPYLNGIIQRFPDLQELVPDMDKRVVEGAQLYANSGNYERVALVLRRAAKRNPAATVPTEET